MHQETMALLKHYGYGLMTFGALIEGETFLIVGGIAAQQGMFHLPGLILLALIGSMIHDCVFFFLGRYAGTWLLHKKPNWEAKVDRVFSLFDRYDIWLILALRFAYGLRTIIPTALGMSHISNRKFLFFDFIGGILWSVSFIVGGYIFGEALEAVLKSMSHYEHIAFRVLIIIVVIAVVVSLGWWLWKKTRKH